MILIVFSKSCLINIISKKQKQIITIILKLQFKDIKPELKFSHKFMYYKSYMTYLTL